MKNNTMKKFISKNSNYRLILKHGIPPEPITGRLAVPSVWVKFQNGIAVVNDDELVELMRRHPAFNVDFIMEEEGVADPYKSTRRDSEPVHDRVNIEYGHVGKNENPKSPFVLPQDKQIELQNYIKEEAKKMALQMAPTLAKEILNNLAKSSVEKAKDTQPIEENATVSKELESDKEEEKVIKGKPGRPRKDAKEDIDEDDSLAEKEIE